MAPLDPIYFRHNIAFKKFCIFFAKYVFLWVQFLCPAGHSGHLAAALGSTFIIYVAFLRFQFQRFAKYHLSPEIEITFLTMRSKSSNYNAFQLDWRLCAVRLQL